MKILTSCITLNTCLVILPIINSRLSNVDYMGLSETSYSPLFHDSRFSKVCKASAGYYIDPTKDGGLNNTLVIAGVNSGYGDFFLNFKCHMDRLGIKFLALAFDAGILHLMKENNVSHPYLMPDIIGATRVGPESSSFFSKNFNVICCRKLEAVAAALFLGYDVVFSDVDIGIIRDPIDYLFAAGIDHVHSSNNRCNVSWKYNHGSEGNTGFYAVRSNVNTIRIWSIAYRVCMNQKDYNDQTVMWHVMRTNPFVVMQHMEGCQSPVNNNNSSSVSPTGTREGIMTSCVLDDCIFSAGSITSTPEGLPNLLVNLKQTGRKVVMAHANYLVGKDAKRTALNRTGLWLLRHHHTPQYGHYRGKRPVCGELSGPLL
eukprot:gene10353-21598_t